MDAQIIFENLIDEFLENGIPIKREKIHPELSYINSVTKLGSCKWNGKKYVISLSKHAARAETQIRNTLAHELIHTLPGCMNHGKRFHQYGALVYRRLGILIQTKATETEANQSGIRNAYLERARYKAVCANCQYTIFRLKKSGLIKSPHRYRCPKCGGHFRIYYINK